MHPILKTPAATVLWNTIGIDGVLVNMPHAGARAAENIVAAISASVENPEQTIAIASHERDKGVIATYPPLGKVIIEGHLQRSLFADLNRTDPSLVTRILQQDFASDADLWAQLEPDGFIKKQGMLGEVRINETQVPENLQQHIVYYSVAQMVAVAAAYAVAQDSVKVNLQGHSFPAWPSTAKTMNSTAREYPVAASVAAVGVGGQFMQQSSQHSAMLNGKELQTVCHHLQDNLPPEKILYNLYSGVTSATVVQQCLAELAELRAVHHNTLQETRWTPSGEPALSEIFDNFDALLQEVDTTSSVSGQHIWENRASVAAQGAAEQHILLETNHHYTHGTPQPAPDNPQTLSWNQHGIDNQGMMPHRIAQIQQAYGAAIEAIVR